MSTNPASDKEEVTAGEELGEPPAAVVFGVHAVRPREISATHIICRSQATAESWAVSVSNYPDVLAAGVTRYVLDTPGHRTPVALFVQGERQALPYVSDDRRLFANGHGPGSLHPR